MIARTPLLHQALADADHHDLVFYPGLLGGHPQGYGWRSGGEVPQEEQDALALLDAVHLIGFMPSRVRDEVGAEVVVPPVGKQVLSFWDAQATVSSPARSNGVHPLRVGEPIQESAK